MGLVTSYYVNIIMNETARMYGLSIVILSLFLVVRLIRERYFNARLSQSILYWIR